MKSSRNWDRCKWGLYLAGELFLVASMVCLSKSIAGAEMPISWLTLFLHLFIISTLFVANEIIRKPANLILGTLATFASAQLLAWAIQLPSPFIFALCAAQIALALDINRRQNLSNEAAPQPLPDFTRPDWVYRESFRLFWWDVSLYLVFTLLIGILLLPIRTDVPPAPPLSVIVFLAVGIYTLLLCGGIHTEVTSAELRIKVGVLKLTYFSVKAQNIRKILIFSDKDKSPWRKIALFLRFGITTNGVVVVTRYGLSGALASKNPHTMVFIIKHIMPDQANEFNPKKLTKGEYK